LSATVWQCRICGRRIPLRVDECFCGAKREQVVAQEKREAARSPTKIPLDVALLAVLVVLVGVFGVHYALRSEAPPPAPGGHLLSVMLATPHPMPTLSAPPAAAPSQAPATAPSAIPSPVESETPPPPTLAARPTPVLTPSPSPSPSPSPEVDEREVSRAAALAAYSAELTRLAAKSALTTEHVRVYKTKCSGQNVGVQISNCDEVEATIRKSLAEMEGGLDAAEDQARRAWVTPGMVRDARAKSYFGTRAWDDLVSAVRQLR